MASMRHTAWAAIPSPRPVKPSSSVVVAFTFTHPTSTPRPAPIFKAMHRSGGAQQRIADRMQQHVCIAVPEEALVVGDLHAADHEPAARDQGMHVEALADAHHPGMRPCRFRIISAR